MLLEYQHHTYRGGPTYYGQYSHTINSDANLMAGSNVNKLDFPPFSMQSLIVMLIRQQGRSQQSKTFPYCGVDVYNGGVELFMSMMLTVIIWERKRDATLLICNIVDLLSTTLVSNLMGHMFYCGQCGVQRYDVINWEREMQPLYNVHNNSEPLSIRDTLIKRKSILIGILKSGHFINQGADCMLVSLELPRTLHQK